MPGTYSVEENVAVHFFSAILRTITTKIEMKIWLSDVVNESWKYNKSCEMCPKFEGVWNVSTQNRRFEIMLNV